MNTNTLSKKTTQVQAPKQKPNCQRKKTMYNYVQDEDIGLPEAGIDSCIFNRANRGRVAIFIDGANLFYAALQLGIEIDYNKLLCLLTKDATLLRAFFYTGVDRANEKQQGFHLWMRRNGYRVFTKDLVQFADGSKKANLEVEIAVDMMSLAPYYDTAVLISGDGDLAYAVNAVTYQGVRVEVISLRAMTSDSLVNVADCFIDLSSIKERVQKSPNSNEGNHSERSLSN